MKSANPTLEQLGWKPFFQQQLSLDEYNDLHLGRIIEQHRSNVIAMTLQGQVNLILSANNDRVCVGDWVIFDEAKRLVRSLERLSIFERKAPGSKVNTQLIAANIDILVIVCSLNQDFNLNRIERYLAIANEASVEPVIVLTKADQSDDVEDKTNQVQQLDPFMVVHAVNALDIGEITPLMAHCKKGKTVAFLGSSGVGKSTLVNGLLGYQALETGAIRDSDSKGRHTTTYRALKFLPQGGILMDTPGMRELQLASCEEGVKETFSEIIERATQCRFNDCEHISEPGCAVQKALEKGELSQRRLLSYQKLVKEQAFNSATLAEKKAKDKTFGKMVNRVQSEAKKLKRGS